MRPTLVVADVHLTRHTPLEVSRDLADLVRSRRGDRLIVAGDLFDRSAEPEPVPSFASIFGIHAELRRALAEHLDAGGELSLLAGNHDAEVGEGSFPEELGRALGVSAEATTRITSSPWMLREGDLHVEHGHVFDPDNAPAHPLVRGTPALGVRFVHEFIAPTGAYAYLNRNDKLPLELFVEAFTRYGVRGPYVVATFFRASFSALREAGPFSSFDEERARGELLLEAFAAERGLAAETLREIVSRAERPTTTDFGATFARLYLDRVACTLALLAAGGCALAGKRRAAAVFGGLGAAAMITSWARGYNRYAGKVVERLSKGADLVAETTGAKLVIFGHAHHAEVRSGYANPGSFAFSPGGARTYLELTERAGAPTAELRGHPKR